MIVRNITKSDYDYLRTRIDDWWRHPISYNLHANFLYHFGDTGFVAEEDGRVIGMTLGFISQKKVGEAYVHMVAVDLEARGAGVARAMYEAFFAAVRARGCHAVSAVASIDNKASVAFHTRMGFEIVRDGALDMNGVPAIPDYSGPGRHRVVFYRKL